MIKNNIEIVQVPLVDLKITDYNPRKWDESQKKELKDSITRFGVVDALIVNSADDRKNVILGGHFRFEVLKELEYTEVPVIYLNIPDLEREKELVIRLNKNHGDWDMDLLAEFDESFLQGIGFDSQELDKVFEEDVTEDQFDINKELKKLNINEITIQKGDIYDLDGSRLMCGDSTVDGEWEKLCDGVKADMCFTDPPYILNYLKGKGRGKDGPTVGFGSKKNRRYLETETLPENFTDLWMEQIVKIQKPDFSIIVYENPKNLRTIWNALEKHWKYRNTIIWHLNNRMQGFAAKYKFFNKYDFAIVGTEGNVELNAEPEDVPLFQEEYETALFATSGNPTWESYEKGKKYCPTDFIEYKASDEKSSGQGIIFGTKPIEILVPYIKVLTKRGDVVAEPFGGSGSTLIASVKMGRRCFIMEKSPTYAEVILNRWEKLTGKKRVKISQNHE